MTDLLNKLSQLIENQDNNRLLEPIIYPTAWCKWCIAYKELAFDPANKPKKIFSVVIEPDKDTVELENSYGEITIKVFTTFEEAVTHRKNYINGLIEIHENTITKLKELI